MGSLFSYFRLKETKKEGGEEWGRKEGKKFGLPGGRGMGRILIPH